MPIILSSRLVALPLALISLFLSARPARSADLTVMTFNTKHGGEPPWNTADQIAEIVAEQPDVVLLQEVNISQLERYVNGINRGLGSTGWHGEYARHCYAGRAPDCSRPTDEAVMILTHLPITDVEQRLIWAQDEYLAARGVLRVAISLDDGTAVQVFACHLPASESARAARMTWVQAFLPWARTFAGPRLAGGDFNDDPSSSPIVALKQEFVDAWGVKGSGSGGTHSHDDAHYGTRIDYLFSAGGLAPESAFVPQVTLSDHRPVVAAFSTGTRSSVAPSAPAPSAPAPSAPPLSPPAPAAARSVAGETVLLDDTFDAGVLDRTKWPDGVFSGYEDLRVPVTAAGTAVRIAPLSGADGISRYNGISSGPYDLRSGGYASVQLVQGPVGAGAYAMFTVGSDPLNFYRVYQGGATDARMLWVQKRSNGVKAALVAVPYSVVDHQYLRVRHDYQPERGIDDVVFEAAPSPPDAFAELYREPWESLIAPGALRFELKGGTSSAEAAPGVIVWDNFRAAAVSGR